MNATTMTTDKKPVALKDFTLSQRIERLRSALAQGDGHGLPHYLRVALSEDWKGDEMVQEYVKGHVKAVLKEMLDEVEFKTISAPEGDDDGDITHAVRWFLQAAAIKLATYGVTGTRLNYGLSVECAEPHCDCWRLNNTWECIGDRVGVAASNEHATPWWQVSPHGQHDPEPGFFRYEHVQQFQGEPTQFLHLTQGHFLDWLLEPAQLMLSSA